MSFSTLLAGTLEMALQHALQQHPEANPMASFQGQVIQLQLQPLTEPLFLMMVTPLQVHGQHAGAVDCCIDISWSGLMQLRRGAELSTLMAEGDLNITGEATLAGQLVTLLMAIDVDWAEVLAPWVGGAMAYRLDHLGRTLTHRFCHDWQRLQAHTHAWFRDDAQLGPTAAELDEFTNEVTQLERQVNALAERCERQLKESQ
ncbi:MAG: SCP2 sterol-binding domain-containing protein [Ferrimonas sp.]